MIVANMPVLCIIIIMFINCENFLSGICFNKQFCTHKHTYAYPQKHYELGIFKTYF